MITTKGQYKTGGASLYVVIFTTLLLGIITLGFIRIMISEARQTTDFDLSQSAYDSALAGVEDAKVALLAYQDCISKGDINDSDYCRRIVTAMRAPGYEENCDIVREMLGRTGGENNETVIESGTDGTGADMDQAYTCVRIAGDTDDYSSDLSENNRVRLIPLRPVDNASIASVRFSWFSENDSAGAANVPSMNSVDTANTNRTGFDGRNTGWFEDVNTTTTPITPPAVELQLIQSAASFTLSQLDTNSGNNTNRGTLILAPSNIGLKLPSQGGSALAANANEGFPASADKAANNPVPVYCDPSGSPYRCAIEIKLPQPIGGSRNMASSFLRVSLPYGMPTTDFEVTLLDTSGNILKFNGVQAKIDSTGRANDLFRRVEARVEMVDVYFPFPEFTLTLTGSEDQSICKDFWVTTNAWNGVNSGQITGQCN